MIFSLIKKFSNLACVADENGAYFTSVTEALNKSADISYTCWNLSSLLR